MNIIPLDEKKRKQMSEKGIWKEECPVSLDVLQEVKVSFINFEGTRNQGSIIVHQELAMNVSRIFQELEIRAFPINSIKPIQVFDGDDLRSMEANNSSGFNGRRIAGTDRWSSHAYGAAIDLNPVQNPFLNIDAERATVKIQPANGIAYVNRNCEEPGMVEDIVPLMAAYGFSEWGGNWANRPDFHHFQLPWDEIRSLPQS